ncbi:hypothetical protein DSLPV1_056 [Dishui lake phycodnavirus 1]|uniref:hypothetical protein n=1 Tax=Dishui lake phycodnavirus 1 TaxID=2079134 RepID=UPI000CD6BBBF|nr:hypothetical protein C5Y57_gp056 [Dishui lake phycodnavirus 1]AUT19027.1 hypothetical protein DSLPV1_056 [Dishui lake phycodnavirus 1]
MGEEFVIDRGDNPSVMNLSADEQRLMDEIEITRSRPSRVPKKHAPPPRRYVEEDDDDDVDLDAFMNPSKQAVQPPPPAVEQDLADEYANYSDDDDDFEEDVPVRRSAPQQAQPSSGYSTIDDEKCDLLSKLQRLGQKKGVVVNKRLNVYTPIEDLRAEYKRVTYGIEIEQSVKFSRRALVACVTGLEWLNKRYDPLSLELNGWSESVMESLDDYDPVLEELAVKYKNSMQMAPEVKLIMMLAGSGFAFHLSNSMFKALPNMTDVLKQNPELVGQMFSAVQKTQAAGGVPPQGGSGYEMKGPQMGIPGFDLSSLMGGISMPPPPPMSTTIDPRPEPEEDEISDIVSEGGGDEDDEDVKEVELPKTAPKKRGRKKKNEINL